MDYLVKFIAHIKQEAHLDGFPFKAVFSVVIRADDNQILRELIAREYGAFTRQCGILVPSSQESIEIGMMDFQNMHFIPMTSVSYMSTEVKPLANPMQDLGDEGIIIQ